MAKLSLLVLLIVSSSCLFSSSHARESQFFNKNPSVTTNNEAVSQTTERPESSPQPEFLLDNQPAHGLYPQNNNINNNNLPSNYNPVSYVTPMLEATNESPAQTQNNNNNNYNNNNLPNSEESNYFVTPEEEDPEFADRRSNDNYNYVKGAAALGSRENNNINNNNNFAQGMSDTRSLENGKYHYDIEAEKYNNNHPYYESFTRTNPAYEGYDEVNNNYGGQRTMGRGGYNEVNNNGGQNTMGRGGYNQQAQQGQYDEFLNNWHP